MDDETEEIDEEEEASPNVEKTEEEEEKDAEIAEAEGEFSSQDSDQRSASPGNDFFAALVEIAGVRNSHTL